MSRRAKAGSSRDDPIANGTADKLNLFDAAASDRELDEIFEHGLPQELGLEEERAVGVFGHELRAARHPLLERNLRAKGGTVVPLAQGQAYPTALAVNTTHLFWVNFGDGTIHGVPK